MRIALVADHYGSGGGLELWIAQVAALLAGRGHEVHVVAFRVAGDDPARVRLHRLPWRDGRLERAAAAARALDAIAPDVVHDTGVGWRYDLLQPQAGSKLANREADLASLPPAARMRARLSPRLARWRREVRDLERRQYVDARGAIAVASAKVARDLATRWGVDAARVRVIPNGVDIDRFAPGRCAPLRAAVRASLGVDADTPVVLFAARNPRLKGLPALLRAAARLRADGVPLRVAAIGFDAGPFRREAERLGVGGSFTFGGPADDPLPWYAAADAVVLPTWYDACSLVAIEGLACGLPVVTTRQNGAAELIAHGRDGYVLDSPGDIAGLAALVRRALDPRERARIGAAARAAAARLTIAGNVDALEALYADIVGRRGGGSAAPAARAIA